MRYFLIAVCLIFLSSCSAKYVDLGNSKSTNKWVYLCGLTDSFDSEAEVKHREILDNVGREFNIRFIAVVPKHRCEKFNNKMCWPQKEAEDRLKTFKSIKSIIRSKKIDGWIGFSNGGYFLLEALKDNHVNKPIITVGAPGTLDSTDQVYVMVGNKDDYAYQRVKTLNYEFIEYEGGHELEEKSLRELFKQVIGS